MEQAALLKSTRTNSSFVFDCLNFCEELPSILEIEGCPSYSQWLISILGLRNLVVKQVLVVYANWMALSIR